MSWSGGDSGKCRAAAYDLHGLSTFLTQRSADLRAMDDWVATGWWTGTAAEAATGSFGKLLAGIDDFAAGTNGLGDTMTEVAGEIDKAVHRAKVALAVGGVLFVVGTAATIVTIGASEGAAAAAIVAGEEEAAFSFAALGTYLSTAFTTALAQNTLRIIGAIGFNLAIPAVGEGVHIAVAGGEFTGATVAGILIGSSFGIFLGELTMLAQLNLSLPVYQQILAGSATIGLAGFAGSATSQQLLAGGVNWKIAGYSGAAGAVIGAVGAGGAAYIINRFRVVPHQLGAVIEPAAAGGEIELGALGTADQLTVSQVEGETGNTTVAQATGGGPLLTEESLAAANLTDTQLADLGASEGRLAAAGQITRSAERTQQWLDSVVARQSSADVGLDTADALAGGLLRPATAAARNAGGDLAAALADARAVDGQASTEFVTAASDSTAFMSARSSQYSSDSEAALEEVHAAATEYADALSQVEQQETLATVGPDITAIGADQPLRAQLEQARSIAAATEAPTPPDLGAVDPGQQLGPDLDRVARNAALKRIVAQSGYGIVIGGAGGAVFGGAVLPAVETPHEGLDLDPPSPDFTNATVTLY